MKTNLEKLSIDEYTECLSLIISHSVSFVKKQNFKKMHFCANRLSSTISGNREMDQLYMTSQASNKTRKMKFSHFLLTGLPRLNKKV